MVFNKEAGASLHAAGSFRFLSSRFCVILILKIEYTIQRVIVNMNYLPVKSTIQVLLPLKLAGYSYTVRGSCKGPY